ncbi:MAG: DUF6445 family protein [Planctomycetota bacterium]
MAWSKDVLRLNPNGRVEVVTVGHGKHRVIVVDDFYADPEAVLALAQGLHYVGAGMHGNFPGTRGFLTLDTAPMIAALSQLWGARLESAQVIQPVVFSALEADVRLNVDQRLPHVDPGVSAMIWLNRPEECAGGTGLYRHTLTGLERVPQTPTREVLQLAARLGFRPESLEDPAAYTRFQDAIVFNPLFAAPEGEYVNDGNPYWELIYLMEMRWNRMVLFDGRIPHSQYLRPGDFEGRTRLNQMLYLRG